MADEKDITTAAEETAVQPAEVQEAANEAAAKSVAVRYVLPSIPHRVGC